MNAASHRARYQGKQLFSLMLAICLPAAILYIRLVLGLAATKAGTSPAQAEALNYWSLAALIVFFAVQLIAARYVQRLFPPASNPVKSGLQYAGVFLICLLFSLTGAIMLEAFGWNVLLRIHR